MEEAGFVDIVEYIYKWPMNKWPANKKIKELGIISCFSSFEIPRDSRGDYFLFFQV